MSLHPGTVVGNCGNHRSERTQAMRVLSANWDQQTAIGQPAADDSKRFGLRSFLLLFAGLTIFLTFLYGQRGLNEPDEGRYAQIALEIVEGDFWWWEPHMSDFGHYDKPPLIYWATALSIELFGETEWAVRFPSAVGSILALVGLAWAAWRLYGRETAWWSLIICATLGQFWLLARFASPDMLLTAACTLAIGAWAEARHRGGHWGFWLLSLFFWSVGWWTKATPAIVPFIGLAAGVILGKDECGRKALRPVCMLLSIIVIGAPWYLAMMTKHPDLVSFFFGRQFTGRMVGAAGGRHKPIYYFLLTSWLLWLPWLPVGAAACLLKRRSRPKMQWSAVRYGLGPDGWIVVIGLIIFSINSSKLPTYTLPLAPWMALALARCLLKLRVETSEVLFKRVVFSTFSAFIGFAAVVLVVYPRFEAKLGLNSSVRPVARELRADGAKVVFLDKYWPGMEFYLGEHVYYCTGAGPSESAGDAGICKALGEPHFCSTNELAAHIAHFSPGSVWMARYRRRADSPFDEYSKRIAKSKRKVIGDFEVFRVN